MKIYVAGPMTGIPSFNVPAFDEIAESLRAEGHEVISPAELDGAESRAIIMASKTGDHRDLPPSETWGFYLARDVKLLADDGVEAIVTLPGWGRSPGALLETFVARVLLGMPILYQYPISRRGLQLVPDQRLLDAWRDKLTSTTRSELFNMKWQQRVTMLHPEG